MYIQHSTAVLYISMSTENLCNLIPGKLHVHDGWIASILVNVDLVENCIMAETINIIHVLIMYNGCV